MEIRLSKGLKKLQLEFCAMLFYLALEHSQQWSYFFSYLAPQKVTLYILPTHFTKHSAAVDLF